MKTISCINEKQVKLLYKTITQNCEINRPISGCVLNIIMSNLFKPQPVFIESQSNSYYMQNNIVLDIPISIDAPLVLNEVEFAKNKRTTRIYQEISEKAYFFLSFNKTELVFPNNAYFKENKNFMDYFDHYSSNEKPPNNSKEEEEIKAVALFYNKLLQKNPTYEGTVIIINVLKILFNSIKSNEHIRQSSLSVFNDYLFGQLQLLNEGTYETIQTLGNVYKNITFNSFEFKIITDFIASFNELTIKEKFVLRKIFNEKSRNNRL